MESYKAIRGYSVPLKKEMKILVLRYKLLCMRLTAP
jgi:hypothetical protein